MKRHLGAVALLAVLSACGTEKSSGDVAPDGSAGAVSNNAQGESSKAEAEAPAGSASNETFARLIAAGGVPERCLSLGLHAGERTPKDKAQTGLMEFNADPYVNPAPPYIAALADAGFLHAEGDAVNRGNPVKVYRATVGNEGMFRWFPSDGNRGGAIHFCPGTLSVDVVSYTEPAEERGMTQARYTYRVSGIPAPIKKLMDSGQIPAGPPTDMAIRGTVLFEGEGTATLVKTSNGWELNQQRMY